MTDEITKHDPRQLLINLLNEQARHVREDHQMAHDKCVNMAREERYLAWHVDELKITTDEAGSDLRIIYQDINRPEGDEKDEDDRLIEKAIELINAAYEKGKYDGRDVKGFFRTFFGRVSEELLTKFDELYN